GVLAQDIRGLTPQQVADLLERPASSRVVPGEVIVKYRPGRSPMSAAAAASVNVDEQTEQ
ncbi:MAG: hypothetical protein GWO40_16290, partial [Gammaproteobacteria bacterium]|nr:hypothetical protein [Gammaproteobacteria bacterium]NIV52934.1 hypothetical protein [Gammaproteobacteria bacterium]NIX87087.1 hypothetical protein [Gammaproteobacteria bacterium]